MYKRLLFITLLCLLFLTGLASYSFAQTTNSGLNLTVSPSVLDITANPGDTIKQKFRVRNNTANAMTLGLSIDKLSANQNGDIQPVRPDSHDTSTSWVTFDTNPVTANPQEWTTVNVTISVPKDAAFGYYYAIRLSQQNGQSQNKSGAKLLGEVVIPLLLTVKSPNAKSSMQLISFAPTSYINEYLPVSFSVVLQNNGNVHIRPKGNIFIRTGVSDSDVNVLDINQAGGAVLPGAKRSFVSVWTDGFIVKEPVIEDGVQKVDSHGNLQTRLSFNWDKLTHFRIGKYTATALVVYDDGTRDIPMEASTTFWVIPWKVIVGALISIVILVFLIRLWLKWYVARQIKKYKAS